MRDLGKQGILVSQCRCIDFFSNPGSPGRSSSRESVVVQKEINFAFMFTDFLYFHKPHVRLHFHCFSFDVICNNYLQCYLTRSAKPASGTRPKFLKISNIPGTLWFSYSQISS